MDNTLEFWPAAPDLQKRTVEIEFEGDRYVGDLVAPPASVGARPLVLVIHNYQGLKQFDVDVAEYLARLGYVGLAIDMYGGRVPRDEREFPQDPSQIEAFQKKCFDAMVWIDHDHRRLRGLSSSLDRCRSKRSCL